METVELKVEGMDCDGCVKSVTRMLSGLAGVQKADVSLAQASAKEMSAVNGPIFAIHRLLSVSEPGRG